MTASKRASSMLIAEKGGAMTVRELQRQVLTYFSQDTSLWHSSHSSPRQRIDIPKGAVVVSMRNQWEKVEWITDATMLSVHLDDTVLRGAIQSDAITLRLFVIGVAGSDL